MRVFKNFNPSKGTVLAAIALLAGLLFAGRGYLKNGAGGERGEVANVETQTTEAPQEPLSIPGENKQTDFTNTATPINTPTPTPKQDFNYQVVTNTPTPYPTSGSVQGGSTYNQEAIDAMWDAYDKQQAEYLACLTERNALIQPLQAQINQKYNEYDSIPEKITQEAQGKDINANQLARIISEAQLNSPLLGEIADLQEQIRTIEYQYPCY